MAGGVFYSLETRRIERQIERQRCPLASELYQRRTREGQRAQSRQWIGYGVGPPPWGPRPSSTCWATAGSEGAMVHLRLMPLLLAALPAALACTFNPRVPDGVVTCAADQDCPDGLQLQPRRRPAARPLLSRGRLSRGQRPRRHGTGTAATPAPGNVAVTGRRRAPAADAEITLPPAVPGTVAPVAARRRRRARHGRRGRPHRARGHLQRKRRHAAAPRAPDRQTYCTFQLGDRYLVLGIDVVTANDPVTTRAHAACWTEPKPLAATTDPAGARRPLARRDAGRSGQRPAPAARPLRRRRRARWWGRWPAPGRAQVAQPASPSRRACGRTPAWSWPSPARCRSCRSATWARPATGAAASCSATGPASADVLYWPRDGHGAHPLRRADVVRPGRRPVLRQHQLRRLRRRPAGAAQPACRTR